MVKKTVLGMMALSFVVAMMGITGEVVLQCLNEPMTCAITMRVVGLIGLFCTFVIYLFGWILPNVP